MGIIRTAALTLAIGGSMLATPVTAQRGMMGDSASGTSAGVALGETGGARRGGPRRLDRLPPDWLADRVIRDGRRDRDRIGRLPPHWLADRVIRDRREHEGDDRGLDDFYFDFGYGWSGDQRDGDGSYFSGSGGSVEVVDGTPMYDYDRGYPYDHYVGAPPPPEGPAAYASSEPVGRHCTVEWVWNRQERERTAVRVCRR